MTMKKQDRKDGYLEVISLMLEERHKEAYDKLAVMCGKDTGLFILADYQKSVESIREKKAKKQPA